MSSLGPLGVLPHTIGCTVQPHLSGPHLSRTSIIQTSWRPANTLLCIHRRCGQWWMWLHVEQWARQYCWLAWAKTDWSVNFSEHCCHEQAIIIGIIYRIGIINQMGNVGLPVIQTISLIWYGSNQPMDKGVRVIEVALYPYVRSVLHLSAPTKIWNIQTHSRCINALSGIYSAVMPPSVTSSKWIHCHAKIYRWLIGSPSASA